MQRTKKKLPSTSWRIRDRMKTTVSVALVVRLNVGVNPPDILKILPIARLQCWIDPSSMSPQDALESIGVNLQKQYDRWQPRAHYKQLLDPTVEDIKKLCVSLRRNAKESQFECIISLHTAVQFVSQLHSIGGM